MRARTPVVLALLAGAAAVLPAHPAAAAATPPRYANCTALHQYYPHGIGRAGAVDRVRSGSPVTTWKRDTAGYNTAVGYNRDLDRDRDGVACERR